MRNAVLILLLVAAGANAELRDPTRPSYVGPATAGVNPAAQSDLRVSAVFISGERRVAIVNGRRVRVGDAVGDAIVTQIDPDRVSFERGGEAITISLLNASRRN